MTNKFQHASMAVLLGALALTGCATQKAWTPELEEAREALQQVSSDPQVAALAEAELNSAKRQLQKAEDASDFFKSAEVISHEAALAKLKALEAQQTARGVAAKQNLRIAQAGGQPNVQGPSMQAPIMAAATPSLSNSFHSNSAQGGSIAAPISEQQAIAQQLAALSQQIMQLQTRIEGGSLQSGATHTDSMQTTFTATPSGNDSLETDFRIESQYQLSAEPEMGAAMAAPAEPELISDPRLHEELRAMNARPSNRGMELTLGERYFEANSARIWTGRAARHLDNIAAVMSENPDLVLEVEAHTDNSGTEDFRNNLSSDRAVSVKSALVLRGVSAARINATGYGDSAPIADNNTELGQLQNRRVEVIFPNVAPQ